MAECFKEFISKTEYFNTNYGSEHTKARFILVRGAKCIKLYLKMKIYLVQTQSDTSNESIESI